MLILNPCFVNTPLKKNNFVFSVPQTLGVANCLLIHFSNRISHTAQRDWSIHLNAPPPPFPTTWGSKDVFKIVFDF